MYLQVQLNGLSRWQKMTIFDYRSRKTLQLRNIMNMKNKWIFLGWIAEMAFCFVYIDFCTVHIFLLLIKYSHKHVKISLFLQHNYVDHVLRRGRGRGQHRVSILFNPYLRKCWLKLIIQKINEKSKQ